MPAGGAVRGDRNERERRHQRRQSLGRRYVDNDENESTILKANGQDSAAAKPKPKKPRKRAPLSPVFAPDGSLLVFYENETEGTRPDLGNGAGADDRSEPGRSGGHTAELFNSEALENVLEVEPAAEQGDKMMSLVSESATDGTIYLDAKGRGGLTETTSRANRLLWCCTTTAPRGRQTGAE